MRLQASNLIDQKPGRQPVKADVLADATGKDFGPDVSLWSQQFQGEHCDRTLRPMSTGQLLDLAAISGCGAAGLVPRSLAALGWTGREPALSEAEGRLSPHGSSCRHRILSCV